MHIISNEFDNKIIKISFSKNTDADAVIINNSLKNEGYIVDAINKSLENALIIINFDDLYYYFHQSGIWNYENYEIGITNIDAFRINNNYTNKLYISFYIGRDVQLSQVEDILEKIRVNNLISEIMFSCCLDSKLNSKAININIFNNIEKNTELNEKKINNMDEFIEEHPYSVIVNYDIANKLDCGKTFRTATKTLEEFKKDKKGKYIKYPNIQPYLTLNDESSYELFIIHNQKIYKLELGNQENTYKIKCEISNINFNIGDDDVFYSKAKTPKIINEETWIIEDNEDRTIKSLKKNSITKEEFVKLNEDNLLFITNPGRQGDVDGSTFVMIDFSNSTPCLKCYRVSGWYMGNLTENDISLDDMLKQFSNWRYVWNNWNNELKNQKFKYIYMGFGNGLSVKEEIYETFYKYLIEEIKSSEKIDYNDKEIELYLFENYWEQAVIKLFEDRGIKII